MMYTYNNRVERSRYTWRSMFCAVISASACILSSYNAIAMSALEDAEMSQIVGQALFVSNSVDQGGLNFTSVGLDVELQLNTNISKIQLGCGGVNGPGECDIDIDNLSLSGLPGAGNRVDTDAILTRPFIEFAIRNNDQQTLREVVGFRLSAENMTALLTTGQNGPTANGINRLSGFIKVAPTSGVAQTQAAVFGTRANEQIDTVADLNILACTSGCGAARPLRSVPGQSAGLNIPSIAVPFAVPAFVVNGRRLTSVSVNANAVIPNISLDQPTAGSLAMRLDQQACVAYFICIQDTVLLPEANTTLTGLNADINFDEALGFIHNLPINNPFSLSFQRENIQWPGAEETALRGWWLSFQDQVALGQLNPADQVDISSSFPQLAILIGNTLAAPANRVTVTTGDGLESLFGDGIRKALGTLNLSSETVNLNLSNLPLDASQNVISNCRGGGSACFF